MGTSFPKISIIMPSLNQGPYIEAAIRSVISQDYANHELFVMDGGSSDETISIIKKYEDKISCWVSEKDSGQSEAINKGLRLANGEIIAWLNSDDYYEPGALKHIAEMFLNNPDAGIIHGKARLFGTGHRLKIIGLEKAILAHDYLAYMRFPQPAAFFSSSAIVQARSLDEKLHYAMDFDLVVKIILAGYTVISVDKVLAGYRLHEASKTKQNLKFLEEWTQVIFQLLNSIEAGRKFAGKLSAITGFDCRSDYRYDKTIDISEEETKSLFLQHLDLHFHYQYMALNERRLRIIADYLQEEHIDFFQKKSYDKYLFRLKILPTFVLRLIRRFTR